MTGMEQGSHTSYCYYILVPDHPRGGTGRMGMEHGSTLSYCSYILAPHDVMEEPVSSLTTQIKSPTSHKSCPSLISSISGKAIQECEEQRGSHTSALVLSP